MHDENRHGSRLIYEEFIARLKLMKPNLKLKALSMPLAKAPKSKRTLCFILSTLNHVVRHSQIRSFVALQGGGGKVRRKLRLMTMAR